MIGLRVGRERLLGPAHDVVGGGIAGGGDVVAEGGPSASAQVGGEVSAGRGHPLVTDVVGQLERALLDGAVGKHRHTEHDARGQWHQLHRAHDPPFVRRRDDDGGVVGEVGEQTAGVVQHLLDLTVRPGEELADLLELHRRQSARGRELVDEEAVALVGGDAPRAGVRLGEVALAFEQRHLVAHGGG